MAYEVLARKWRPQVFEDIVGQGHITQTLINAFKVGRLAHAYLFAGPRGVGKTSAARILAKAMNCLEGEPGIPCNKCTPCREITDGSSVDVQEIDGASNRGIDEIRELRENVRYMPSSCRYRVYIIDEVHMLTLPAFNALLKTLEEPPDHVKFVFATTEPHKVPATIHSRCQKFDFKRIALVDIVKHLENIAASEGIKINRTSLASIAREAEGSMRDGQSLLDQVLSFAGKTVEDKDVTEILGIIDRGLISSASRAIVECSPGDCLEIVDRIYNYGYDIKEFYRALMQQFRNLLVSLVAPDYTQEDMTEEEREEVDDQARKAGTDKLRVILDLMISREEYLRFTSHPRLVLETTMVKLSNLDDFLSIGELLEKIESLEKRIAGGVPPAMPGTGSAVVSEPQGTWSPGENKEQESRGDNARQGKEEWERFLSFLSKKCKPVYNVLKDWGLSRISENTIELKRGNGTFSSSYFDDPEKYKELNKYCREFFQRNIQVKILGKKNSRTKAKAASKAGGKKSRPEDHENPGISSPVQDILDVFEGQINHEGPGMNSTGTESGSPGKDKEASK